jgi:hypothetical protein
VIHKKDYKLLQHYAFYLRVRFFSLVAE